MRRLIFLCMAVGLVAAIVPGARAQGAGRYIVVLDQGANASAVASEHAAEYSAQVSHVYESALSGYAAVIPDARLDDVRADERVAYVVADTPVEMDAKPVSLPPQTLPTGIDRADAEQSATAAINGSDERVDVDVAVIDTGIDLKHPDLNVAGGVNCATGKSYSDGNGHGTHVAGTIAAKDDAVGVVGMAPGARLWAVRVLDNRGSGWRSWVICGIDWVTANAGTIEVANMSLGGSGSDDGVCGTSSSDPDPEHQAICASVAAGVTYAVAAGNQSEDAATHVPAAYDEVITVSALADFDGQPGGLAAPTCRADVDDTFADFSNFGADVDLIAPGVCINSTWKGSSYETISGTSMASPHVAGAAALYLSTHPGTLPADVKAALVAAGTFDDWSGDPDATKEPLLKANAL